MKRVKEKKIEDPAVKDIRGRGALRRKMNGLGHRSWPDDLFIAPNGAHIWVEFKKPDEDPTPLQAELHRDLASRGIKVHIARSIEEAIDAYHEEVEKWQQYRNWLQARSSTYARTRKKRSVTF